jgi:hypothetical protein
MAASSFKDRPPDAFSVGLSPRIADDSLHQLAGAWKPFGRRDAADSRCQLVGVPTYSNGLESTPGDGSRLRSAVSVTASGDGRIFPSTPRKSTGVFCAPAIADITGEETPNILLSTHSAAFAWFRLSDRHPELHCGGRRRKMRAGSIVPGVFIVETVTQSNIISAMEISVKAMPQTSGAHELQAWNSSNMTRAR